MEKFIDRDIKLDKNNAFKIFGNKIYVFDGSKLDSWKKARGFKAANPLLNEGTALHNMFVKEIMYCCSYTGARIIIDANPENPAHPVKEDYINKDGQQLAGGCLNIRAFNFMLHDNIYLNQECVESIIASMLSGMFTDHDIFSRWAAAERVIYKVFHKGVDYITSEEAEKINFLRY